MKYLIHACPKRLWYVTEYLVPSMIEQGIDKDDIVVFNDDEGNGNLVSYMKSLELLDEEGGTWHLQDDVIISKTFKQDTEAYMGRNQIICGFCCAYDSSITRGTVDVYDMWYSFPCIYIPNYYARSFKDWWNSKPYIPDWLDIFVRHKKGDDSVFKYYMEEIKPGMRVLNAYPNLVDHVDWLIGGSIVNTSRKQKIMRAIYFLDSELVDELEEKLKCREQDNNKTMEVLECPGGAQ